MPLTQHRYCEVCGKARDLETGLCPTPEKCAALRSPHVQVRTEEIRDARRVKRAEFQAASMGDVGRYGRSRKRKA